MKHDALENLQGLKPLSHGSLYVAAKAATHKEWVIIAAMGHRRGHGSSSRPKVIVAAKERVLIAQHDFFRTRRVASVTA